MRRRAKAASFPAASAAPRRQRWRPRTRRPRRPAYAVESLVLAVLVLAGAALVPATWAALDEARLGVPASTAGDDDTRRHIEIGDRVAPASRPTWASHGDREATTDTLRAARKVGTSGPVRFASRGSCTLKPPRGSEPASLDGPDASSVRQLVSSLGSAPRGPPTA